MKIRSQSRYRAAAMVTLGALLLATTGGKQGQGDASGQDAQIHGFSSVIREGAG